MNKSSVPLPLTIQEFEVQRVLPALLQTAEDFDLWITECCSLTSAEGCYMWDGWVD